MDASIRRGKEDGWMGWNWMEIPRPGIGKSTKFPPIQYKYPPGQASNAKIGI